MPELPEVETVRRGLQPVMEGSKIVKAEVRRKDLRFPFQRDFVARLEGPDRDRSRPPRQIPDGGSCLRRRAPDASGHVRLVPRHQGRDSKRRANSTIRAARIARTTMWCSTCRRARPVVFNDPRRFGYMKIIARKALDDEPLLRGLGPEPLGNEFDAGDAGALLRQQEDQPEGGAARPARGRGPRQHLCLRGAVSRASVAATAGRDAGDKEGRPTDHARRLVTAIHAVLNQAIKAGGSSLRDHRQTSGELGYFQHSFQVYDREGEKCQTAGCSGIVQALHPERALDLLVPEVPEVSRTSVRDLRLASQRVAQSAAR